MTGSYPIIFFFLLLLVSCSPRQGLYSDHGSVSGQAVDSISGTYGKTGDSLYLCDMTLRIRKKKENYTYRLTTFERTLKGKARIKSDTIEGTRIYLEGIPWAEYEGDISDIDENEYTWGEKEIPTEVVFFLDGGALWMQNYGNTMNYYTVLNDCGPKFIQLIKID